MEKGGLDEAFDVGAGGVVCSEFVAVAGVKGALEEGAEDGGFDLGPILGSGMEEEGDLFAVEGEGRRVLEEAAVEVRDLDDGFSSDDGGEVGASRHFLP